MSNVSHVSTVDRGLKMKIKRTKVGPAKTEPKHEVVKGECTTSGNSAQANAGAASTSGVHILNGVPSSGSSISGSANLDKSSVGSVPSGVAGTPNKTGSGSSNNCLTSDASKDKSPKVKTPYVKKDKCKEKSVSSSVRSSADSSIACSGTNSTVGSGGGGSNSSGMSCGGGLGLGVSNGLDVLFSQVSMEPRVAVEAVAVKREVARPDPYEFNAKVEDGIGLPPKKLKTDTKVGSSHKTHTYNVGTGRPGMHNHRISLGKSHPPQYSLVNDCNNKYMNTAIPFLTTNLLINSFRQILSNMLNKSGCVWSVCKK